MPSLRLLGAERGPEAVHLAVRHRAGLHVELAGLREGGIAQIEVLCLEQRARLLADRPSEDRRVEAHESPVAEELPDPEDHLVTDAHDVPRTGGSEPQVAMVEEEVDPVFLGTDRIVLRYLYGLDPGQRQLVPARGAGVLPHRTADHERGLLCESLVGAPGVRLDVLLDQDALRDPAAVANQEERDPATRALVIQPAAQLDRFSNVVAQVGDRYPLCVAHFGREASLEVRLVNSIPARGPGL